MTPAYEKNGDLFMIMMTEIKILLNLIMTLETRKPKSVNSNQRVGRRKDCY